MNILILDTDKCGLPFALACQKAGHYTRLFTPPTKIGEGLIERVKDWRLSMVWADLIFVTDNSKITPELAPYFKRGYPIFGPNPEGAKLELDREAGQDCFAQFGIDVLPYQTFKDYDEAITYVKEKGKPFVSKPWGGNPDKSLSYVPKSAEDLVCRLERWKREGVRGEFLLQKMVKGLEIAVGGWFGPGGWSEALCENWEEKRLMAGGLGPNTGEMGTVVRYTKRSKLFEEVLKPVTGRLEEIGYVGYVDVNCLIDESGTPWPLEFTCRPGWPLFNIQMALHKGDPAKWMADLLAGKDTLSIDDSIAIGVVMAMGDFPWDNEPASTNDGWPIRGLSNKTLPHVALSSVRVGSAPVSKGKEIVTDTTIVSAGSYVLIATGLGKTVSDARSSVYSTCDAISWPPHRIYRNDIGCRLEEDLPALQALGYARGMKYA